MDDYPWPSTLAPNLHARPAGTEGVAVQVKGLPWSFGVVDSQALPLVIEMVAVASLKSINTSRGIKPRIDVIMTDENKNTHQLPVKTSGYETAFAEKVLLSAEEPHTYSGLRLFHTWIVRPRRRAG